MAMRISYAHTGDTFDIEPSSFTSVEALKDWLGEQVNVATANQILTTVKGSLVKLAALSTEKELFLYSRQLIVPSSSTTAPTSPLPSLSKPQAPPDRIENQNDLRSWENLFANRVTWASSILAHAESLVKINDETNDQIAVMQRSVAVAATNLEIHIKQSVNNYEDLKSWALDTLNEQEKLLKSWKPSLERLRKVVIHEEVSKLMESKQETPKQHKRNSSSGKNIPVEQTLQALVRPEDIEEAGRDLEEVALEFERKVTELGSHVHTVKQGTGKLSSDIAAVKKENEISNREEGHYLLEDIAATVQKMQHDQEHVSSLANNPKGISSASKIGYQHTKTLLPQLTDMILQLSKLHQADVQKKNTISQLCVNHLQTVSQIEQQLYRDVSSAINKCEAEYETKSASPYNLLSLVSQLPAIYGSFLVECVRRKEWIDRMRNDGAKLAEEFAGLKDEEEKRRKKWYKMTTQSGELSIAFLPPEASTGGLVFDLNVTQDEYWPSVPRSELDNVLSSFRKIEGLESTAKDLAQQMIDLDKPTKRQKKSTTPTLAIRAFKMGSIHEAAMSNSMMFNGSDGNAQIKAYQADRAKWDDRVKMYESRIRKLEDLLHRQKSGNIAGGVQFNPTSNPPTSPLAGEPMSRSPSQKGSQPINIAFPGSSRRPSVTDNVEKQYLTRISELEKELSTERTKSAQLKTESENRETAQRELNERISEADQTKNDLMANLEAQQSEFKTERSALQTKLRDLEEQLDSWKQRVDEVYAEFDKLEESKLGETERKEKAEDEITVLRRELDLAQKELSDKASIDVDILKGFQEERDVLQQELNVAKDDMSKLKDEGNSRSSEISALRAQLLSEQSTSSKHKDVITTLRAEIASLKRDLETGRRSTQQQEETHTTSMNSLKRAYTWLHENSSRGSGTIPDELDILAKDIESLAQSNSNSAKELRKNLESTESSLEQVKREKSKSETKLESRTLKARDLTQRLYTHNARAGQLLEALGFTVVIRNGLPQIMRTSRSSSQDPDLGRSISMSTSLPPLPTSKSLTNGEKSLENVRGLYWMDSDDPELESDKYAEYLQSMSAFDVDAFGDAVSKRVKEVEHVARKCQKQARDYRDKYHKLQRESGEKIAFKSFREGDLAMFLPTRNQVTRPWAAFNVGAPHYFLREQDSHKLAARDWLVARITRIEERVVDLSRSTSNMAVAPSISADGASLNSSDTGIDDDNPFQLSDGLRWYLLDAVEEKPGAPATPGLGSSTVASAIVDAKGSLRSRKPVVGAKKTLSKNLAQSGISAINASGATSGGEASSVKSRNSLSSLIGGRKDSGGNTTGGARPVPAITAIPGGSAVVDTDDVTRSAGSSAPATPAA